MPNPPLQKSTENSRLALGPSLNTSAHARFGPTLGCSAPHSTVQSEIGVSRVSSGGRVAIQRAPDDDDDLPYVPTRPTRPLPDAGVNPVMQAPQQQAAWRPARPAVPAPDRPTPPRPTTDAPLLPKTVARGKALRAQAGESESMAGEAIGKMGEIASIAGDMGGYFTAQGLSNANDTFATGTRGAFADMIINDKASDNPQFANMTGLGASDLVGGMGGMVGGGLGVFGGASTLMDKDAGKLDKLKAGVDVLGGATGMISGGMRSAAGIMDMKGLGDTTKAGDAVHSSQFGFKTPLSGDIKYVGDSAGVATGVLGTASKAIGAGKQAIGAYNSWTDEDGKLNERGAWSKARSLGRGVANAADIVGSAASAGKGLATIVGQAQNSGVLDMASNAGQAAQVMGQVAAGAGVAIGGAQMLQGGYKIYKAGNRRAALTERMKDQGAAAENEDERQAVFEHLHEIQKKKQVRGGIDAGLGAAATVGGALTLSGFGAIPGAVIGGAAAGIKLGQLGLRHGKQYMRDMTAEKLEENPDRSELPFYLRAIDFDETKSSKKKAERNAQTTETILGMEEGGDDRNLALKTLGLSEKQLSKGTDAKGLLKEQDKRLKKLGKQKAKVEKSAAKKGEVGDVQGIEDQMAMVGDNEQLKQLIQEERILKGLKKR